MPTRKGKLINLPSPPAIIPDDRLIIAAVHGDYWRYSENKHPGPLHYGKATRNRFDAPKKNYGVLYAARDMEAAFVEIFVREPARFQDERIIDQQVLCNYSVVTLTIKTYNPLALEQFTFG